MRTTTMVVGAVAALLAGCISTNSVLLDPSARFAPVPWQEVRVFLDRSDVPYEYEEFALVHANGDEEWTNEADLIEAIREEAADIGAHAVILEWIDEPSGLERLADAVVIHEDIARRRGRAIAIRWLPERPR
jgi:hypothetical protein